MTNDKVKSAYKYVIEGFKVEASKIKDKDKVNLANKFLRDLAKDDFNIDEFEVINHSLYKPTDSILVDRFISENPMPFYKAFILAESGKVTCVVGHTGIGKFYTLKEYLKENKMKIILVVPLTSLAEQMHNSDLELVQGSYGKGGKSVATLVKEGHNVIVCTWDKLKSALDSGVDMSEYILCRDESHEVFSNDYRNEVIRPIEAYSKGTVDTKFKGIVDITATPTKLDMDRYSYIVDYQKKLGIKKKHILYNTIDDKAILDVINNANGKVILIQNDIGKLKIYEASIKDKKKCEVVYSEIKEISVIYKSLVRHSTLGDYDCMLGTDMFNAGLNCYDKDVSDIIIVGIKDPSRIAQIDSRCREVDKIDIHIFNNYTKNRRNFRSVRNDIKSTMNELSKVIESLNSISSDNIELVAKALNIKDDKNCIYIDEAGKFAIDEARVRTVAYDNHYNTRTREQFKVLLSEYANNIELREVTSDGLLEKESIEAKRAVTKEGRDYISGLETLKGSLVGCCSIILNETLTDDLKAYLDRNNLSEKDLRVSYKAFGIDLDNKEFVKHNRLFTELVTEHNYDLDFAWKWASLSKANQLKAKEMIDFIRYMKLKSEMDSKEFEKVKKANAYLQRFDYLHTEFTVGMRYTNDIHIPILLKGMNKITPGNTIGDKVLKSMISSLIKINRTKVSKDKAVSEIDTFYKSKLPKKIDKQNRYAHYVVESYINEDDIAKLIGVDTGNITLTRLINN